MSSNATIHVVAQIKETEKAIQVLIVNQDPSLFSTPWVPKSQIISRTDSSIEVPQWLAARIENEKTYKARQIDGSWAYGFDQKYTETGTKIEQPAAPAAAPAKAPKTLEQVKMDKAAKEEKSQAKKLEFAAALLIDVSKTDPDKLMSRIQARLIGLGHTRTCGRCGGSGRYSFNLRDLDMCYGCGGSGLVALALTDKLLKVVKVEVAEGKLQPYFDRLERRRIANSASKTAMAAWSATGISKMYEWHKAADGIEPHKSIADINAKMCDACQKVSNQEFVTDMRNPSDEQIEKLVEVLGQALVAIEAAEKELEPFRQ